MKNIHILPTEKPSRLFYNKDGVLELHRLQWRKNTQHIYITSDEEIKEGDWFFNRNFTEIHKCIEIDSNGDLLYNRINRIISKYAKKIILTTDQDLIKDGVWGIEDGFLEWFVKNPSCEYIELKGYAIILPGESCDCDKICSECKPKQETLEEVAENELRKQNWDTTITLPFNGGFIEGFQQGAKWQQEQDKNKFSEEDMIEFAYKYLEQKRNKVSRSLNPEELLKQFKKK
jgi:hypothetical protein